jgi:hypothetical protein
MKKLGRRVTYEFRYFWPGCQLRCKPTISTILIPRNYPIGCLLQLEELVEDRKTNVLAKAHRKLNKLETFEEGALKAGLPCS